MKNEIKNKLFEENLRKFKYRVDYKVNESPKYRPLVNDGEEFDNVPLTNEAGEQEDAMKPEGNVPPAPSNDQPMNADAPTPAFDKTGGETQLPPASNSPANPMGADPMMDNQGVDPMGANPMGADMNAQPQVDSIQNDIIKHNIEALKSIHDKMESLDMAVQGLNGKIEALNADVEEVREPTNTEKLMSKKNVSYPYYFNLNDFWNGSWFNEQRMKENEKGINELPDGTFVADFDDLPQKSKMDVQNSFNEF